MQDSIGSNAQGSLSEILQDLCRNFKDFCKLVQDPLSDKTLKDVLTWRSSKIYLL